MNFSGVHTVIRCSSADQLTSDVTSLIVRRISGTKTERLRARETPAGAARGCNREGVHIRDDSANARAGTEDARRRTPKRRSGRQTDKAHGTCHFADIRQAVRMVVAALRREARCSCDGKQGPRLARKERRLRNYQVLTPSRYALHATVRSALLNGRPWPMADGILTLRCWVHQVSELEAARC